MLVDSAGQEPNRLDEMLGLASYFGHLLSCLEVARRKGHKLITIATGQAIGGAFICYGMFADRIYALDSASVGLMPIAAMSAVTKIPAAVLQKLSKTMPSLEFGAAPFALLGGVEEVWSSQGRRAGQARQGDRHGVDRGQSRRARQEARRSQARPRHPKEGPRRIGAMTGLRRHTLVWLSEAPQADERTDDRAGGEMARGGPALRDLPPSQRTRRGRRWASASPTRISRTSSAPRRRPGRMRPISSGRRGRPPSRRWRAAVRPATMRPRSATGREAARAGLDLRVYGSWMWQALTGERHVQTTSDLDLLVDVAGPREAEAAAAFLARQEPGLSFKLDGELSFPGRGEVQWREFLLSAPEVLLKAVDSVRMVRREDLQP